MAANSLRRMATSCVAKPVLISKLYSNYHHNHPPILFLLAHGRAERVRGSYAHRLSTPHLNFAPIHGNNTATLPERSRGPDQQTGIKRDNEALRIHLELIHLEL